MPEPQNPFPGMNPYFQSNWGDVHHRLLGSLSDSLVEELPDDLVVRVEERVQVADSRQTYRPDVALVEPWQKGFPPVWTPENESASTLVLAEPIVVYVEPEKERWLEIRNPSGRVVTVIELLSPTNKNEDGWRGYRQKQKDFLAAGINLVEIDLIRGGQHVLAVSRDQFTAPPGTSYLICVARQFPGYSRREVYPCPLRESLPTIRIPLRADDPDAPLALQPLVDERYRKGRYWLSDYSRPLEPPLPADDAAWVNERLRAAGLP